MCGEITAKVLVACTSTTIVTRIAWRASLLDSGNHKEEACGVIEESFRQKIRHRKIVEHEERARRNV